MASLAAAAKPDDPPKLSDLVPKLPALTAAVMPPPLPTLSGAPIPPPMPALPKMPTIPGLEDMPSLLSPEMKAFKDKKDGEDYTDLMRKKQALMSIPGMNLAQADEETIFNDDLTYAQLNSFLY